MKKFNIVVASDINLKKFIIPCIRSIQETGYEPMIYDLGGLGIGKEFECSTSNRSLQKFPKKPFVIKDALLRIPEDEWLAWIDADCIMKSNIDDAISDNYDVGVTFRKNHLNSGVNFWKHNSCSLKFLDCWAEESLQMNGDQNGLNQICQITKSDSINQIYKIKETKVKIFDAKIYNNFFFIKNQDDAKILHYKSKHRDKFPFI
jgi:hypothetical protein